MQGLSEEMLDVIAQAIFDKKGSNILALDLREISSLTDFCIIAEGNIDRHNQGIANHIWNKLEEKGFTPLAVEGLRDGQWIVMDYGNVFVHLLIPDFREKYALEELWHDSKIVNVKIVVPSAREV